MTICLSIIQWIKLVYQRIQHRRKNIIRRRNDFNDMIIRFITIVRDIKIRSRAQWTPLSPLYIQNPTIILFIFTMSSHSVYISLYYSCAHFYFLVIICLYYYKVLQFGLSSFQSHKSTPHSSSSNCLVLIIFLIALLIACSVISSADSLSNVVSPSDSLNSF